MNFIDIAILLVLAITILGGFYRGFVNTVLNIGATIASLLLGRILIPLVSGMVKGSADLFNMLLYYTEGSEYVAITDVELTRAPIASISSEQLHTVLDNADMPIPMDRCVMKNIASEAFRDSGVTTLGDYFNQTIVCVVINILALFLLFVLPGKCLQNRKHLLPALFCISRVLRLCVPLVGGCFLPVPVF